MGRGTPNLIRPPPYQFNLESIDWFFGDHTNMLFYEFITKAAPQVYVWKTETAFSLHRLLFIALVLNYHLTNLRHLESIPFSMDRFTLDVKIF